jgi:hypothetical protein
VGDVAETKLPGRIVRIIELTDPARLADFAALQKRKGKAGTRSFGASRLSAGKRVVSVVAAKARLVEHPRIDPTGARHDCLHLTLTLASVNEHGTAHAPDVQPELTSFVERFLRTEPFRFRANSNAARGVGYGPGSATRRIASTRPR